MAFLVLGGLAFVALRSRTVEGRSAASRSDELVARASIERPATTTSRSEAQSDFPRDSITVDADVRPLDAASIEDEPETPPPSMRSAGEVARERAREYYRRDREFLRRSFMAGADRVTGDQLRQLYDLDEGVDPDDLAVAIEAETTRAVERLTRLSEDCLWRLDDAVERALASGAPDVVPATDPVTRRNEDEFHRIVVDMGGELWVYRIRTSDDPEFANLFSAAQRLTRAHRIRSELVIRDVTGHLPRPRQTELLAEEETR